MSGIVWAKWFFPDWAADPALKLCSLAAQGLWMRLLCQCAESDRCAVEMKGKPLSAAQIAVIVGRPEREVSRLIDELEANDVFSRDPDGAIYSRRMRRDADRRATDIANGRKGGNPRIKGDRNPPDNGGVNPPRNPRDKGKDKAQKPEARSQEEGKPPKRVSPSSGASAPRDEPRADAAEGDKPSNVVEWEAQRRALLAGTGA